MSWNRPTASGARPIIIGHRGMAMGGENTPRAFDAALAIGADGFETDVQFTSDGQPASIHDPEIHIDGKGECRIEDLSLAEILAAYPETTRLTDALPYADRATILIDVKVYNEAGLARFVELMRDVPPTDNIRLGIAHAWLYAPLKAALPQFEQLALATAPDELAAFRALGGSWVRIPEPDLGPTSIADARAEGYKVLVGINAAYPNNVGPIDAPKVKRVLDLGPDAIMTDRPDLALADRVA